MSYSTPAPAPMSSGNPALSDSFVEANLSPAGWVGIGPLFVFVLSIFDGGWLYSESFRTIGLVVTVIAIVLAALSRVLDFGTLEAGVEAGAPKELEWYLAFSLMVTLIWLYLTVLKLLALFTRNR